MCMLVQFANGASLPKSPKRRGQLAGAFYPWRARGGPKCVEDLPRIAYAAVQLGFLRGGTVRDILF